MTLQVVPDLAPDASGPDASGPNAGPVALAAAALRRSLTGSPGRLRVVGAAGILAVLLLAAVGTLAMQARASALDSARADAEQLVRVQTLRTALVQADADATNAYLTGGLEPPAQRAEYEEYRSRAARLIAEASRANPADATTLGQVNDVLVRYAGLIESARANNRQNYQVGTAYLSQASNQLRDNGLSALARVVDANQARLDGAYTASRNAAYQFWVVALIALAVLLWAQVSVARHSHRYLNVPLAGATVGLLVAIAVCGLGLLQAQSRADQTRSGDYARTAALAQARVNAFDAKSKESLTLINRGSGSVADPAKTLIEATRDRLDAARASGDLGLKAWTTVHEEIRALDNKGDWEGASARAIGTGAQDSNVTFRAFDLASAGELDQAAAATTDALASAGSAVALRSWLLLVVALLAAAGVWWGISERLGEYR